MAEETPETDAPETPVPDEKIVPMDSKPTEEPKEMTVEEKINAIVQQALPREQFQQTMSAFSGEMEKLGLRIKVLEERSGSEQKDFAQFVIDGTIARMKEELQDKK